MNRHDKENLKGVVDDIISTLSKIGAVRHKQNRQNYLERERIILEEVDRAVLSSAHTATAIFRVLYAGQPRSEYDLFLHKLNSIKLNMNNIEHALHLIVPDLRRNRRPKKLLKKNSHIVFGDLMQSASILIHDFPSEAVDKTLTEAKELSYVRELDSCYSLFTMSLQSAANKVLPIDERQSWENIFKKYVLCLIKTIVKCTNEHFWFFQN